MTNEGNTKQRVHPPEYSTKWRQHMGQMRDRLNQISEEFEFNFVQLPDGDTKNRDWMMWQMIYIVRILNRLMRLESHLGIPNNPPRLMEAIQLLEDLVDHPNYRCVKLERAIQLLKELP